MTDAKPQDPEIIDLKGKDLTNFKPELGKCYANLPIQLYHSLTEFNGSTQMKTAKRSFENYEMCKGVGLDTTIALERGNAFHLGMQARAEGWIDQWDAWIKTCSTKTILTKDWFAVRDANSSECFVLPEHEKINSYIMSEKLYNDAKEVGLFDDFHCEISMFWRDMSGILCKCRPDLLSFRHRFFLDWKSTKTESDFMFSKDMFDYLYHFSLHFYREGIMRTTGIFMDDVYIASVRNTPPFETDFFRVFDETLDEGEKVMSQLIATIKAGKPNPQWKNIGIPYYGFTKEDEDE
jgi:hypothetical protein